MENLMFVFKTIKDSRQFIKLTENNFIEATKRAFPYYQTVQNEVKHYAYCPDCNNPIVIVNLHVDKGMIDENKRTVQTTHARHVKRDVEGIGKYDQAAYDECPYANPISSISKEKRIQGPKSNEILELVKSFPDVIDIVLSKDIGISPSEELFRNMLKTFKQEDGHLYKYINKYNIPYAFAYMSDSQNLMKAKINNNTIGNDIIKSIKDNSKWCDIKYSTIFRKNWVTGFVNICFYFSEFGVEKIDGIKNQKFTLVINESYQGEENELFRKEIIFDLFYYYNLINKRIRYSSMAKDILG